MERTSTVKPRRVHAVGAYGMANFGDQLFVRTVEKQAHLLWPGASVRTFAPLHSEIYMSPGPLGQLRRLATSLAGLAWADTVAMCGGSILQDVRGVAAVRVNLARKGRLEALGVSVGPFKGDQSVARVGAALGKMRRIVVRDVGSLERVHRLFPQVAGRTLLGGDLAALTQPSLGDLARDDVLTICPSAAAQTRSSTLTSRVIDAASRSGTRDVRLLALSCSQNSDDRPICVELRGALRSAGFRVELLDFSSLGVEGTCEALGRSRMVLSQRLHGAVVAYLSRVPFALEPHHDKCAEFCRDIRVDPQAILSGDTEWGSFVEQGLEILPPRVSPETYYERALKAYSAPEAVEE